MTSTLMVCGSRTEGRWSDVRDLLTQASAEFALPHPSSNVLVLHGGAEGVDSVAHQVAIGMGWRVECVRPDYTQGNPRIAPKLRNVEMVERADFVAALWDGMSPGTAHAIAYAVMRGKRVLVVERRTEPRPVVPSDHGWACRVREGA